MVSILVLPSRLSLTRHRRPPSVACALPAPPGVTPTPGPLLPGRAPDPWAASSDDDIVELPLAPLLTRFSLLLLGGLAFTWDRLQGCGFGLANLAGCQRTVGLPWLSPPVT